MFYNTRELYKLYKNEGDSHKIYIDGKKVSKIQEVFNKEMIPETHPYYEFYDIYAHTVITFTDGTTTKIKDEAIQVHIEKPTILLGCCSGRIIPINYS